QLNLPSVLQNIASVEPLVETIREDFNLDDEIFANMLIALTEAVNNAIMHGNASDPNKMVQINVQSDDHQIGFIVRDEGKGFDYNNLPDPTAPENLEKPSGRGIFL